MTQTNPIGESEGRLRTKHYNIISHVSGIVIVSVVRRRALLQAHSITATHIATSLLSNTQEFCDMAYNLYQAQMARAWAQRIEKEQLMAERFWSNYAVHEIDHVANLNPTPFHSVGGMTMHHGSNLKDAEACSSIAPTYVSDLDIDTPSTELLRERLTNLEQELMAEREKRIEMEEKLKTLNGTHPSRNKTM